MLKLIPIIFKFICNITPAQPFCVQGEMTTFFVFICTIFVQRSDCARFKWGTIRLEKLTLCYLFCAIKVSLNNNIEEFLTSLIKILIPAAYICC